jgi:large subunit ribosomal protein L29
MRKTAEYRGMSDEQLGLTLTEVSKNLFHLRVQSATERLETPSEIRKARREIARLKTIQRERELQTQRAAEEQKATEERTARQKAWVDAIAARKKAREDSKVKAEAAKANKAKAAARAVKKSEGSKGK